MGMVILTGTVVAGTATRTGTGMGVRFASADHTVSFDAPSGRG
jgi:hypothetical protein